MKGKKDTLCLACGYKWHSRIPPKENPYFDRTQCPMCYAYSIVEIEQYKADLQHLRKTITPEDAKKILKLFAFAVKNRYVKPRKGSEKKYLKLLKDLANPDSLLGEKGTKPEKA